MKNCFFKVLSFSFAKQMCIPIENCTCTFSLLSFYFHPYLYHFRRSNPIVFNVYVWHLLLAHLYVCVCFFLPVPTEWLNYCWLSFQLVYQIFITFCNNPLLTNSYYWKEWTMIVFVSFCIVFAAIHNKEQMKTYGFARLTGSFLLKNFRLSLVKFTYLDWYIRFSCTFALLIANNSFFFA